MQRRLKNKIFKIFGVHFLKKKGSRDGPPVLKSDQFKDSQALGGKCGMVNAPFIHESQKALMTSFLCFSLVIVCP